MKPCSKNRKLIAWLALDALDPRQTRDLRAHLESCQGCRGYLDEISNVTKKLAALETGSNLHASEAFHQKVAARLRAENSASVWEITAACFRAFFLNWRVAVPVIGAIGVAVATLFFAGLHRHVPTPAQPVQVAHASETRSDPEPTLSNYQKIANKSLDGLDEVLTRQGNRNLPRTQTYTASMLPRGNTPD
jgi:predicted anti-sigma-YlaC factor YlaD